jgi:hypothetical protein
MSIDEDPERPGHPRRGGKPGWTVFEPEATYLREAYQRVARGDSIAGTARWLNEQGQVGPTGTPFRTNTLRSALASPRQAGLVVYRGQLVGEAAGGQRVIDPGVWQQVQAILQDPAKDRVVRERTLLAGLCECERCGERFSATTKEDSKTKVRYPVLKCRGCGMSRRRALVEPLIIAAVGEYLMRHREGLLVPKEVTAKTKQTAHQELAVIDREIAALDDMLASGSLRAEAYARGTSRLYARRDEAVVRVTALAGRPATAGLVGLKDPAAAWERLVVSDVAAARAVLRELVAAITIIPAAVSTRPQPEDVAITFR